MKLSEEQVRHWKEEGYVAVPHFFSAPELEAMRKELDRLKAEGLLRNVATEGDGKTLSILDARTGERLLDPAEARARAAEAENARLRAELERLKNPAG